MGDTDSSLGTSAGGQPSQLATGGSGVQQNSTSDLAALANEMREIKRMLQSDKDRGLKKHEKRISDLERIFVNGGMAQEDAAEVAKTLLPSTDPKTQSNSTAPGGTGPTPALSDAEKDILEGFGLSLDDPDVVATKQSGGGLKEIAALAKQKVTSPASAAAVALPGGTTGSTNNQDEMMKQYSAELSKLRGDSWAITQLQKKFREKGLKI